MKVELEFGPKSSPYRSTVRLGTLTKQFGDCNFASESSFAIEHTSPPIPVKEQLTGQKQNRPSSLEGLFLVSSLVD